MLVLDSVSKRYNHRRRLIEALSEVNLRIEEGELVSVVGPSGSGKSTLLLLLGGMLSPCSGRVLVDEVSLFDLTPEGRASLRRANIGFVFQTFNLIPYLSAIENVQTPLLLAGADDRVQSERAAALLERVGLADRAQHKPCELSVGQQQRVALARMMANDPKIILADEPTGNLDPRTRDEIVEFLIELNGEGKTVIIITHDPEVAGRAHRTIHLESGRIVREERGERCCVR